MEGVLATPVGLTLTPYPLGGLIGGSNSVITRHVAQNEIAHSPSNYFSGVSLMVGIAKIFKHFSNFRPNFRPKRLLYLCHRHKISCTSMCIDVHCEGKSESTAMRNRGSIKRGPGTVGTARGPKSVIPYRVGKERKW